MAQFELRGVALHIPDHLLTDSISRLLQTKRYESGEAKAILRHLTAKDSVLELGGGAGYITTLIAKNIGPERLVCVEAHKNMIGVITDNLARNGVSGVDVLHAAVVPDTYTSDTVRFHKTKAFFASSALSTKAARNKQTHATTVPAVRINELLQDQKPTFVVMDIEGVEFALFETPWPRSVRILVVELHPDVYNDIAIKHIFDQLSKAGFAYCPAGSEGAVVVFKRITE